jgi:copper chaperone CopZ
MRWLVDRAAASQLRHQTPNGQERCVSGITTSHRNGRKNMRNSKSNETKTGSSVPTGKVKSLKLSGIHNCCQPCCEAIKKAIGSVDGVTGNTAVPRETQFQVTGDFSATALIESLHAAGFHAEVDE